jgi:DnaJ-domain-containing protein 1
VTTFADIVDRSQNPIAAAMLLVFSWIACSDGEIAEEEMEGLLSIAESSNSAADLRVVIELAKRSLVEDLQLGCEILRDLDPKHRRLILQMAISIALEDGYLTVTEGHLVRFIADLLAHSPTDLDGLFREMTGESLPPPADPSSLEWWNSRQRSSRGPSQPSNGGSDKRPSAPGGGLDAQRLRDLGVLGLEETATIEQVKEAYRRMAQVHHPDKFVTLGPEAVKAAEITFRRIRAAFERLTKL